MSRPLVLFVDIDDTLVRSFGSKRIPMTPVIERIRALHAEDDLRDLVSAAR